MKGEDLYKRGSKKTLTSARRPECSREELLCQPRSQGKNNTVRK
jgi:hypothetical protein